MIIDYQADWEHAQMYDVCDAATLEPLGPEYDDIFYADDSRGVIRRVIRDERGSIQLAYECDPSIPLTDNQLRGKFEVVDGIMVYVTPPVCIAWREERLPIRILRKQEA